MTKQELIDLFMSFDFIEDVRFAEPPLTPLGVLVALAKSTRNGPRTYLEVYTALYERLPAGFACHVLLVGDMLIDDPLDYRPSANIGEWFTTPWQKLLKDVDD